MKDISCLLSGLLHLLAAPAALLILRKKTKAKIYPAIAALAAAFPIFFIAGAIRSQFSDSPFLQFSIYNALLYGVFEEGGKFLMLRFVLAPYITSKEAAAYGIGHSAFEDINSGITCFGLIGTGKAAADILPVTVISAAEGMVLCTAITLVIYYGIAFNKSRFTLPAAMLLHAVSNLSGRILPMSVSVIVRSAITIAVCIAAFRLWSSARTQ